MCPAICPERMFFACAMLLMLKLKTTQYREMSLSSRKQDSVWSKEAREGVIWMGVCLCEEVAKTTGDQQENQVGTASMLGRNTPDVLVLYILWMRDDVLLFNVGRQEKKFGMGERRGHDDRWAERGRFGF